MSDQHTSGFFETSRQGQRCLQPRTTAPALTKSEGSDAKSEPQTDQDSAGTRLASEKKRLKEGYTKVQKDYQELWTSYVELHRATSDIHVNTGQPTLEFTKCPAPEALATDDFDDNKPAMESVDQTMALSRRLTELWSAFYALYKHHAELCDSTKVGNGQHPC